jgi:hypothetical protein
VEHGQEVRAYRVPQDLADGVGPDYALNVQATRNVRSERASPDPGGPPDEHHYRLGHLAQDTPLVQARDYQSVGDLELCPHAREHLFLLDQKPLLRQKLDADLARYPVGELNLGTRLGQGLG